MQTWSYDGFGELQTSTDVGGARTTYRYDNARQLVGRTNNRREAESLAGYNFVDQNLSYSYDAAGQMVGEVDHALNQVTTYQYNAAGQHTLEKTTQDGVIYQDQVLAYDTLGRLTQVVDNVLRTNELTTYDAVGNVRHVQASFYEGGTPASQSLWFIYDSMNRQVLADGLWDSNSTSALTATQGHLLAYDKDGNRTSDTHIGTQVVPFVDVEVTGYDESGAVTTTRTLYQSQTGAITHYYNYDAMDRLSQELVGAWGSVETGTTEIQVRMDGEGDMTWETVRDANLAAEVMHETPTRPVEGLARPEGDYVHFEQAGKSGTRMPYERTEGLGTHSSLADLLETGAKPGNQGIILTDRSVKLGDLYTLSQKAGGIEYLLATEMREGKMVKTLYSGDAWSVAAPKDARPLGHVHPNAVENQHMPSTADMNVANRRYFEQVEANPNARPEPNRIIWGPGEADNTLYYGGFGKSVEKDAEGVLLQSGTEPPPPFMRTESAGTPGAGSAEAETIGLLKGVRAGGADRLPSIPYAGERTTLFHYTNEAGMNGIVESEQLFASKGFTHARYGDGQYMADISPDNIEAMTKQELTQQQVVQGKISLGQVSSLFFNRGNLTSKISHFVEIDITDLPIRQGLTQSGDQLRTAVQVLLGDGPLDLADRIVRYGKVL